MNQKHHAASQVLNLKSDHRSPFHKFMMTGGLLIGICGFSAWQALALDSATERRQAALAYVQSDVQQAMIDQMTSAEALKTQLNAMMPPGTVNPAIDQMAQVLAAALNENRVQLELAFVEAASKHFTVAEIEALMAFSESPEGASVAVKMQPFFADLSQAMAGVITGGGIGGMGGIRH